MNRETYQEILDKLKDLDSWLSSLGLSKQADRIRLHISNIRKLQQAYQNGMLRELTENQGKVKLMWSLIEAMEFADIYFALCNYERNVLRKKLKDALKGPVDPSKETHKSNVGRNTMFELNLAGRLHCQEVPVYLKTNPDILCKIGLRKIYIQCKRPFLEDKISRNISTARRQLTRDLNNSEDKSARGLIAISVSRVRNPGGKVFLAESESEMKRLGQDLQTLGKPHSDKFWAKNIDTRIIGILFHIITPAFVEDIGLLTAAQQIVMFPPRILGSSDRLLLQGLTRHFKKS